LLAITVFVFHIYLQICIVEQLKLNMCIMAIQRERERENLFAKPT